MSTAHITIDTDGTNHLSLDGAPATPVRGTGQAAQGAAMDTLRQHAQQTQQTVSLHVQDSDGGTYNLRIAPDGQVWTAPPVPTETDAPEPLTIPRVDQTPQQGVTEVHGAQPDRHTTSIAEWTNDTQPDPGTTHPRIIASAPSEGGTPNAANDEIPLDEWRNLRTGHHRSRNDEHTPEAPAQPANTPASDPVDADPRWSERAQEPATQGFRGTLNGMGLKLAPTDEELAERREALRQEIAREEQARLADEQIAQEEAAQETRRAARAREAAAKDRAERAAIQTQFEEPRNVLVANDKGGQGKTSATYCIAATAGRIRGGDVIAWDANETRGNLGFRAKKAPSARSVVDLLEEAADDFTTVEGSKRATLARFTRSQGDNLFTVLASDESRDRQDLVDADAFEKVHEILGRFYSLILIDTGNNHRVSHFKAALEAADQLVIPVSAGADGAHAAETMMDTLESLGYGQLIKNAVVLLNDSATRRGDATGVAAKFEHRVRAIIPVPFDPALDSGDEIDFDALQPSTRAAYQEATAAIAHGLADTSES